MSEKGKQPVIVLHVVGRLDMGGAESRIMDLYRKIDRERVQFYFVQHTKDQCYFAEEIGSLGGKIFTIPRFTGINFMAYRRAWQQLFTDHPEIQVVHGHMTSTASIYLPLGKRAGVRMTIAHARSAGVDPGIKGVVTRILRRKLAKRCDHCFTCSQLAGEAVFSRAVMEAGKVVYIPNAIEIERFAFDAKQRKRIREELNLENAFVIGHVGRFSPVKNHEFLLAVLAECVKQQKQGKNIPNVILILLGDGELRASIQEKAKKMGLEERILFLGNQKEIWRYYQGMDFFLLPSFYEGLPGTAIEAQASGLPGILSDQITKEAVVTDLMQQRSIHEPASQWAGIVLEEGMKQYRKQEAEEEGEEHWRRVYANKVRAAGFAVQEQVMGLQRFYEEG